MAVVGTAQVLIDDVRNLVMQFSGTCDGEGDEDSVVKVDVSELLPSASRVKIVELEGGVNYGVLKLLWDGPHESPVEFLALEGNVESEYRNYGGLNNKVEGSSGDILFSTEGFQAGSNYNLIMTMVKK